jgi:phosphoglycolate phosphatase-like HAD superfamily hydrolase
LRISSQGELRSTDAIVFDVDGVLIDSSASYDRAIVVTVAHFLSNIFGLKLRSDFPIQTLVETLRATGQFNNDIDATAAILVSIVANLPVREAGRCFEKQGETLKGLQEMLDCTEFVASVLALTRLASDGFACFIDQIRAKFPNAVVNVDRMLVRLAYPGGPSSSLLTRIFDEYYYGAELLKRLHGLDPLIGRKNGLIDQEKVLVSAETLRSLSSLLPNGAMGIISGRSRMGTERTLGELIGFFADGPMVFLEDHDPHINSSQPIPGKPSPEALFLVANHAKTSKSILYVGDSAEDLMMTNNANALSPKFTFCGVAAASIGPRASALAERGADAILESVNDLPSFLLSIR